MQDADVPAHAPLQPPNVDPESGWAWSVTKVLLGYRAPQVVDMPLKPLWQLIPGGLLVTLPLPKAHPNEQARSLVTRTERGCSATNVAVTERASASVTVHDALPVHTPLQPLNSELKLGSAVNVTEVPTGNDCEHVVPQWIPAGLLVTVPLPSPVLATVSVCRFVGVHVRDTAPEP
ncbi:MAG TPA: hypothetical protein VHG90_14565 [Acidimicrobiales bacterium]|nr:hypothetical protein [Acidimicrobiales bacterium]